MNYSAQAKLIQYLKKELQIADDAIAIAVKQHHTLASQLPIILWQFGFISLSQLNQVFEWLEQLAVRSESESTSAA
ncbi:DUF2949 domain-containing protein [Acaryochloris sp. IP29b_bin.148]|uniref:DUF2949 domain-containing protein n=1 Tax=Acaryochloris sp. IP29b_bin.148 TaxID=2969218 RepID=UPI0026026C83|nr:DUF2949 domain-containing protein [Acaryochloris sp. IP29b_bin.148]